MPELVDDAELALTELVANVVRHVPGSQCTLLIMRRPSGLRVEVTDACAGAVRPRHPSDPLAEDGRGLLLVEAVTDRWGCLVRGTGRRPGRRCGSSATRSRGVAREAACARGNNGRPGPYRPVARTVGDPHGRAARAARVHPRASARVGADARAQAGDARRLPGGQGVHARR
ncbi:ATP-binding protein [Streptomyces purpureus]|nr:ATP-binding protein [Streptomyces purpureus]